MLYRHIHSIPKASKIFRLCWKEIEEKKWISTEQATSRRNEEEKRKFQLQKKNEIKKVIIFGLQQGKWENVSCLIGLFVSFLLLCAWRKLMLQRMET
jgi:hypothetical protein